MSTICEKHGIEKRQVPAGVSKKTNKPYPAFEVCGLCQNEKGAQSFVQRAQEFTQPKDDSIAKMADTKNKAITKAHRENIRAQMLTAATNVAIVNKQTEWEAIRSLAETYINWVEGDGIPF